MLNSLSAIACGVSYKQRKKGAHLFLDDEAMKQGGFDAEEGKGFGGGGVRIIWCSDLDFSLHAFRLRVDYFLLEPITEEAFQQGLSTWSDGKKTSALFRADHNKHNNEEDY